MGFDVNMSGTFNLVQALWSEGLVDECEIAIAPIGSNAEIHVVR